MLFIPLVLLPGIENHPDRRLLLYKTGIKFRLYGWFALAALFITGVMNMHYKGFELTFEFLSSNGYGELLGIKLAIFITMILIGVFHDIYAGTRPLTELNPKESDNFKLIARWSGRIILLLALSMAFIGVALSRGGF